MHKLILALATAVTFPLPALAQVPSGIAFVQAPEQSSGVAMGATPEEAFVAATAICIEGGAYPEDCLQTNWCNPAGWSVDLFVQHREGIHWHEVVCGLPSEALAKTVGEALCAPEQRPDIIECLVVQIYDPNGAGQMEW